MIDSWSGIADIMDDLRRVSKPTFIGLDSEWKPLFLCTNEQCVHACAFAFVAFAELHCCKLRRRFACI
jgi:hypothetical protein